MRVAGKNFVFASTDASTLSVKLSKEEAAAVTATDPDVVPTGYGLGRHGWVSVTVSPTAARTRWKEIEEWVRTSYSLVAPKPAPRSRSSNTTDPRFGRRVGLR